jgi:RluA family pseudouridine synthase
LLFRAAKGILGAMKTLTVEPTESGLTALDFLQRRIPAAPSAYLRQLLNKGKVLGAAGPLAAGDHLATGARVNLPASGRLQELLDAPEAIADTGIQILFESREILIVDKPAGLAIHSGVGHEGDNLTARVAELLARRGDKFRVAPIHRLDLETSGPVLFGKGKLSCGELGQLFIRQEVDKYYLALASGKTPGSGELASMIPAKGTHKEALTTFVALARSESASLLELCLHTGRQHQIRRQLADIGHPIFGDRRYGGPCPPGLPRIFLHCRRLAFTDPFTGSRLAVDAPLPADLAAFLPEGGLKLPKAL